MFTENQVRQFYVLTTPVAPATTSSVAATDNPGKAQFVIKGDEAYLAYSGAIKGDLQRGDLIKKCNIMDVRYTDAANLVHKMKKVTVALAADLVDNSALKYTGDYILNVDIHNYVALDYNTTKCKFGAVRGYAGMATSTFYSKLAENLTKNFKREPAQLVTITSSADGITIEEVEQPWRRGAAPQEFVNFEVNPTTIYVEELGGDVKWGEVTDETAENTNVVVNSKKVADMEWFFHKERGDRYGEMCWPYNIDTVYQVDPANTDGYSFLDIHFYFEGNSHNVGKSEKTLTIVGTKANIKTLTGGAFATFIEESGAPVTKIGSWT